MLLFGYCFKKWSAFACIYIVHIDIAMLLSVLQFMALFCLFFYDSMLCHPLNYSYTVFTYMTYIAIFLSSQKKWNVWFVVISTYGSGHTKLFDWNFHLQRQIYECIYQAFIISMASLSTFIVFSIFWETIMSRGTLHNRNYNYFGPYVNEKVKK